MYIWDSKEVWIEIIVVFCEFLVLEILSVVSLLVLLMVDCRGKKRIGVSNECFYIDFGREIGLIFVIVRKFGINVN